MTSGGVEAFKAAIRRSLPLIIGLIVLGVVAVNVFKQAQGPQYDSSARVLITTTPLSSIITGTQASFVDPARAQQTAIGIAASDDVYQLAARSSDEQYGNAGELKSATTVTADPNSDLITFTSSDSSPGDAIGIVNSVTDGYITFRGQLASSQAISTIDGLRSRIATLEVGSAERENLQNQLNNLQVLRKNSNDAQVVQEASSASKSSPAPFRDSLVGLSIGFVIALLLVALREAVDTRIRSESDVEEILSTPVLASVRSLPRRARMVTYGRHEAAFADAYALLAAQIAQNGGTTPGVLAVTSSVSGEGKTTTAANLAVSLARRGSNVILADFDFRKPTVSDLFGLPSVSLGALQVMSGKAKLDDALWSVTLVGTHPRVSRNGVGGGAPVAEENVEKGRLGNTGWLKLLSSGGTTRAAPHPSGLRYLLDGLRKEADIIILDTPPALLTVEVAELSRLIDTVIIVVRQGRASQRNLRALWRQSKTWPAEVAGAVLTDVNTESKYAYYGGR